MNDSNGFGSMNSAYLLREQEYHCGNLSCTSNLEIDSAHLVNVVNDSDAKPSNFIALCGNCNQDYLTGTISRSHLQAWRLVWIGINASSYSDSDKLRNFVLSQHNNIQQYLPDKTLLYRVHGKLCHINLHESHMMFARALGIYEPEKTRYIKENLYNGNVFIDVGSNRGDFSLLASDLVGEHGHVHAIEPEHENAMDIESSIALNAISNISLHECALSDSPGEALLYLGDKSGWHSLKNVGGRGEKGSVQVPTTTLDRLVEASGVTSVDMIKIDVEGAEIEVLKGGFEVLSRYRPKHIIVDVHPYLGVNTQELVDIFKTAQYKVYDINTGTALEHIGDSVYEIVAIPA